MAALTERVDNLYGLVKRVETNATDFDKRLHDVDKKLEQLTQKVDHLDLQLSKVDSRRWELWKLVLAAFLGGILTLAVTVVSGSLSRLIGGGPSHIGPAVPDTQSNKTATTTHSSK